MKNLKRETRQSKCLLLRVLDYRLHLHEPQFLQFQEAPRVILLDHPSADTTSETSVNETTKIPFSYFRERRHFPGMYLKQNLQLPELGKRKRKEKKARESYNLLTFQETNWKVLD